MLPYTCETYKDALKQALEFKKAEQPERKFSFQGMAAHCRIQKTYLSKVLNHDGHLSEDQLFDALEYLEFEREPIEFVMLLLSLDRSSSRRRKDILARTIFEIRQKHIRTEANLKVQSVLPERTDLFEYYLNPLCQILHMGLTIRRFQQNPLKLAEPLHLAESAIHKYMEILKRLEIIDFQFTRGTYTKVTVIRDNLHLPQDSVLQDVYTARLRLKAIDQAEQLDKSDAYRFSVVFSTDPKTREKIHSSFLTWLKSIQKLVSEGKEEEVFQINFDLLKWT